MLTANYITFQILLGLINENKKEIVTRRAEFLTVDFILDLKMLILILHRMGRLGSVTIKKKVNQKISYMVVQRIQ